MTANTPRSKKGKGRSFQNAVAEDLRQELGFTEQDIRPAIMGESGVDIKLSSPVLESFPYSIECKNQETVRFWEWWEQAEANAGKVKGTLPVLVMRKNYKKPVAVIDWQTFLTLTRGKR